MSTGAIEAQTIVAADWNGTLSQNNTGSWALSGAGTVNSGSGTATATNTTAGITTTVEFAYESGNATVESLNGGATFVNLPGAFVNGAENDSSLGFTFYWDRSPRSNQPAEVDGGSVLVTIRFSEAQTNVVLNIDRLGGVGNSKSNSSLWTLLTADTSMSKLSGVNHLEVTSNTFFRTPDTNMTAVSGEAGSDGTVNTAAGSILIEGTYTELQFRLTGDGPDGAGADGIELGFIVDPKPTATNDTIALQPGVAQTVDLLFGNNGNGADSDPQGDALVIVSIADPANANTVYDFLPNTTITLGSGTTVTFGATASDPVTIVKSANAAVSEAITYTIADPTGNTATASVYMEADNDGDGVANVDDIDDDNDGILDTDEGFSSEAAIYAPDVNNDAAVLNASVGVFDLVLPLTIPGNTQLPNNGVTISLGADNNAGERKWDNYQPPNFATTVEIRGVETSLTTKYLDIVASNYWDASTLERDFSLDFGVTADSLSSSEDQFLYVIGVAGLGGEVGGPSRLTSSELLTVEAIDDAFNTGIYSYLDDVEALPGTSGYTISTNPNARFTPQGYSFYSVAGDVSSIDFQLRADNNDQFGFIFGVIRITSPDADSDGLADYLDIDKDNDGITDNVEAQTTAGYIAPSGVGGTPAFIDTNNDGLDDNYDATTAAGAAAGMVGTGLTQVDTDGDGTVDTLDSDSDADGISDVAEAGHATTTLTNADADNDGLDDAFDTVSGFDVNDDNISGDSTQGRYSAFTLADSENDTNANEATANRSTNNATPLTADLDFRDRTAPPVATADTNTVTEDITLSVPAAAGLLANDTDPQNDTLTITQFVVAGQTVAVDPTTGGQITLPGIGQLTIRADGSYTFVPAQDANGAVPQVTYTVSDGAGGADTSTLDLTITPVNDAPVAQDDVLAADEDTPLVLNLLGNDSDVDDATLSITQIDGVAIVAGTAQTITLSDGSGTVQVAANGTITFTPATDFNGAANFNYTVADAAGLTDSASVTINVDPTPEDDSLTLTTVEDTPVAANPLGAQDLTDVASVTYAALPAAGDGVLYYTPAGGGAPQPVPANTPLTVAEAATVEFRPAADFNGTVPTFTATITDSNGDTASVDFDVTVTPVNDAPVAGAVSFATDEDQSVTVDPLNTAVSDADDTVLTITAINGTPIVAGSLVTVDSGTVTLNNDGTLTFTPDPDFNGPASFSYTVSDPAGLTGTGTVSGLVEPLPEVADIDLVTAEDSPLSLNPLAGQDEGDVATVTLGALPAPTDGVLTYTDAGGNTQTASANQVLTAAEAATLVFTPALNFNGTVPDLAMVVTDANGDTANISIGIVVTPVNDGPTADDETFIVAEDTPITIDVLDGDTDVENPNDLVITKIDGTPITAGGSVTLADGSTVTLNVDGTLTFDPFPNYNGPAAFTYTISDPEGLETTASVTGEVNPVPDPLNLVVDTPEDTPVSVDPTEGQSAADFGAIVDVTLTNIPAAGEGTLTYIQDGTGATITVAEGDVLSRDEAQTLQFNPAANYNGSLATPFTYTFNSGLASEASSTYQVDVVPVNDAPVASNDTFLVNEDASVTVNVIANDTDLETPAQLTIKSVAGVNVVAGQTVDVGNGTVTVNGDATALVFTPDANYNGPISFDYTAVDPSGGTDTATVSGYIEPLPEGGNVAYVTPEDTAILVNPLRNETAGTVTSVTLTAADLPDTATEGVLTYEDGAGNTVTLDPAGADVTLTPAQAATLTFTPVAEFNGALDQIAFTVTDTNGDQAAGVLDIEVGPVNDAPVATDLTDVTPEDTPLVLDIIGTSTSDIDNATGDLRITAIEGQAIVAGQTVTVTNGSVTLNFDGTVTFTPDADYFGPASFGYTVSDPGGLSDSANVSLTVDGLPELQGESYTVTEDDTVALSILDNDDLGDATATVALTSVPDATQGVLTYTAAGGAIITVDPAALPSAMTVAEAQSLVFTPAADFDGTVDPIAYTVTDGDGDQASAQATIAIDAVPDAVDDVVTVTEDTAQLLTIIANDDTGSGLAAVTIDTIPLVSEGILQYTDQTGAKITVGAGTTLTPTEVATLTFIPADDYFGPVTAVNYTITDTDGDTDSATLTLTVDGIPELQPDVLTTDEDTPVALNIADNDDLGDGPATFAITALPPATQGTVSYTAAGNVTITLDPANLPVSGLTQAEAATLIFTPATDFDGAVDPITYQVTDADGDTATGTVTVQINATPDPVADTYTVNEDTRLALPITGNDDVADGLASVTIDQIPTAAEGVVTYVNGTGTRVTVTAGMTLTPAQAATLAFDPAAGTSGVVGPLAYTITDIDGDSAASSLTITVDAVPDLAADAFHGQEGQVQPVDILANDADFGDGIDAVIINSVPAAADGALTYDDGTGTRVTVAAGDALTEAQAATLQFEPFADFNGNAGSFTYTVRDLNGDEVTATFSITLAALVEANDDTVVTPENTPIALTPISNDDPGGPFASVELQSGPTAAQGTLTYTDANGVVQTANVGDVIDPDEFASLLFTPVTDFQGPVDPIVYKITDPGGNADFATIDVVVDGLPEAENDVVSAEEDASVPLDLLANDDQGDGPATLTLDTVPDASTEGVLTYVDGAGLAQTATAGTVLTATEVGTLTFQPVADFEGTLTVAYTLTDQDGDTDSATLTLDLDANPDTVNDVITVTEDTPLVLDILANDDTGDGVQSVTINALPSAAQGTLTYVDATGQRQPVVAGAPLTPAQIASLTFRPVADFFGPVDVFTYTLTDLDGDTSTATVSLTVDGIPEPVSDVLTVTEDTPLALNFAANDDLGDGPATIALTSVPPVTQGTLTYTDAATGQQVTVDPASPPQALSAAEIATMQFVPAANYDGAVDPIAYTVTDADGDTADAQITLTIDGVPDPVADALVTDEDTPLTLNLTANDDLAEGLASLSINALPSTAFGTLTYTDASGATQPVVAGAALTAAEAATVVFTPAADVSGAVPAITYTLTDLSGNTATSQFSVYIDAVPDPVDDTLSTLEETTIAIDVLADNGAGADDTGDGLVSVTIDQLPPAAQGTLTYTDAGGLSQPVFAGTPLTPAEAATLLFTPNATYNGAVNAIPYTLTDTNGDTGQAAIRLTVDGVPDLVADAVVTGQNQTVAFNILANDADFGDGVASVTIVNAPTAAEGVLTYTQAGTGTIITVVDGTSMTAGEARTLRFNPEDSFFGAVAPVTYQVADVDGDTDSATLSVFVNAQTDAAADDLVVKEGTPLDLVLLSNDQISEGASTVTIGATVPAASEGLLTYTQDGTGATITVAANESLSLAEFSSLIFTPAAGFTGTVTGFDYTVTASPAGGSVSDTASVALLVDPRPVAVSDNYATDEDTNIAIPLAANDDLGTGFGDLTLTSLPPAGQGVVYYISDATSLPLAATVGTALSQTEAASLYFAPAADFAGTVSTFQYTLTDAADRDGVAETVTGQVDIQVDAVPDPVDDTITVNEDTPTPLDILGNDDGGNGVATVTLQAVPSATEGLLSYTDAGGNRVVATAGAVLTASEAASLVYEPAAGYDGAVAPITYVVTDTNGDQGSAVLNLSINPLPDVVNDVFVTNEDTAIAINPLANDETNLGGDRNAARVAVTAPPATQGTLTYTAAGGGIVTIGDGATVSGLTADEVASLVFTPAADFNGGVDPISYTVTDANGDTATASIAISVDAVPDPVADAVTVTEDTPAAFSVIGNDDHGDGPATVVFAALPDAAAGILSYVSDAGAVLPVVAGQALSATEAAALVFTPAADFDGVIAPLAYTITDANGDSATSSVTLTMNPAPDLAADVATVPEDGVVALDPLANDPDRGDGIATVAVTAPAAAQGALSYLADPNDPASRTTIPAGAAASGLTPAQAATLQFAPAADYDGQIAPISYTVTDGTGDSESSQIVLSVDAAPDAIGESVIAEQGRDLPLDLLRNDDVGDGLAGVRFDALPLASEGSLTVLDGGVRRPVLAGEVLSAALMDTLVFSPASGFNGAVSQVTYAVIDGTGDESSADLTVYVDPAPIAQGDVSAPTANGSPVTIDVLANDQTGDVIVFASLRLEGTTVPGQSLVVAGEGTWSVDTVAGTVTFTPEAGFVGDPTPVSYTVQDDEGYRSTPATIYADYVPLASTDVSAPATPGQPVTVDVIGNDATGDAVDPATVQLGGTAAPGDPLVVAGEGTWSINPATGAITFTPEAGFVADPTPVTYTVSDANGNTTDPATLDIDVVPVGARDVSSPAATGTAAVIDVLGNDVLGDTVDPATVQITGTANPGDPLVVAGEGTWSVNPTTGAITFTPEAGFVVDPTPVTYVVSDTDGNVSAPIAVAADYVPVAASDVSLPSAPGSTVTVDVLANDVLGDTVDPTSVQITGTANAGDPLVVAGEGTWTVNPATGAISFTPEPGFYDDPTPVTYTVSDDQGNVTAANSVTVDYEPTAVADTVAGVLPGDAVTIDVLGNDLLGDAVDPATVRIIGTANPGDPLVVPGEGVWTVNPTTGAITFTPAFGFTLDPTPISYVVADAQGNISDPVQVSIDYLTIVENTDGDADPNAGDAFEFEDDGEAELSVEPIVRETADNAAPLHSITPLDAEFPILGAVNSLLDLQGVTALPTEGVAFFAGLAAQYPITLAVDGVNPEPLFNDLSLVQGDSFDVLRGFSDVIGETISGYLLVGKDRVIILLSDLDPARSGGITALIGATEKAGSPLVAAITGQDVRTVKGDTLAVLREDPEGTALYLETADANGVVVDVATSEDGQVRFEATENQNNINFTGQVAGIVDARQHEMDALAASLQIV